MNNNIFESVGRVKYNNKLYEIFLDRNCKYAVLEVDKNNMYHYPYIDDVLNIVYELNLCNATCVHPLFKKDGKHYVKKFKFSPMAKVKAKLKRGALKTTILALISSSFLSACAKNNTHTNLTNNNNYTVENTISYSDSTEDEYNAENSTNNSEETNSENTYNDYDFDITIDNNRLNEENLTDIYVMPANDEYDYKFMFDYDKPNSSYEMAMDVSASEKLFGITNPSKEQLFELIDNNQNIDSECKSFIKDYLNELFNLYPEINFAPFYYNLKTLKVNKVTPEEIHAKAISLDTLACYVYKDNAVYIDKTLDINSEEGKIILRHELIHAMRNVSTDNLDFKFDPGYQLGQYTDESFANYLVYLTKAEGKPENMEESPYYVLSTNYLRVILHALRDDYKPSDYFNHSIVYLAKKMDNLMGDENYGFHILHMIDTQLSAHYSRELEEESSSYQEVYNYMIDIYCKKDLKQGMSSEEAEQVWNGFWSLMGSYLPKAQENGNYTYINEDLFRTEFEDCCKELGINVEHKDYGNTKENKDIQEQSSNNEDYTETNAQGIISDAHKVIDNKEFKQTNNIKYNR